MREVFWKIILNEWNDPKVKGVCKVKKNIIFWHLCCTFVIFASIFLFLYSTVFTMYYYICMITLTEKSQETVVWVGSTKIGFWQFYLFIFFLMQFSVQTQSANNILMIFDVISSFFERLDRSIKNVKFDSGTSLII